MPARVSISCWYHFHNGRHLDDESLDASITRTVRIRTICNTRTGPLVSLNKSPYLYIYHSMHRMCSRLVPDDSIFFFLFAVCSSMKSCPMCQQSRRPPRRAPGVAPAGAAMAALVARLLRPQGGVREVRHNPRQWRRLDWADIVRQRHIGETLKLNSGTFIANWKTRDMDRDLVNSSKKLFAFI